MSLLLFMALRQLWARRGLNATAICGVALGVFMLILISAVMRGLQAKFLTNMTKASAHVTVLDKELRPEPPMLARFEDALVATRVSHENPSDRQTRVRRPDETVRMLERLPGVVAAAPSVGGSGIVVYGGKEYPVEVRGISPVRQDRVTPLRQYVTTGSYRAFSTGSDVVMLGSGVASRTGAKVGDAVLLSGPRGNRMTLHVAAICDSNIPPIDNVRVYVPLASAQAVLGRPDVVSRIDVRVADPDDAPQMTERVERILGYDAESWQEQNANFLGLFVQQRTITSMVIGAILLVGGFGILAIQIMIVLQKTRDIAIMRSYGFLKRDILVVFLSQGAILALLGAGVGMAGARAFLSWLGQQKTHFEAMVKSEGWPILEEPKLYGWAVVFALGLGLVASLLPSLRAARVEPVDVLRGQIG